MRSIIFTFICIVLIIALQIPFIPQTFSHTMDNVYSYWIISEKEVKVSFGIGQDLIMILGPLDSDNNRILTNEEVQKTFADYIKPYLEENVTVMADGKKLPVIFDKVGVFGTRTVDINLTFTSVKPIRKIKIICEIFSEEGIANHENYANIESPSAKELIEYSFTQDNKTWEAALIDDIKDTNNVQNTYEEPNDEDKSIVNSPLKKNNTIEVLDIGVQLSVVIILIAILLILYLLKKKLR